MRILLAEDDELLGSGIRAGLTQQGFHVDWVRDGVAAERELLTGAYQAVVLDLGLPRQDGLDSLKAARARRVTTPVLVLTARDAVSARIEGLDTGADDYLVKPVDLFELAARLRALVRRAHGQTQNFLEAGPVRLDPAAHQVWLDGAPVELSGAGLAAVVAEAPAGIGTEVFAWGRLPLAVSARCFTARYNNLQKDHCEFKCIDHPDGLALDTQDGLNFLVLNGVQTQSAGVQNLAPVLDEARAAGADVLRLSPQLAGMGEVVRLFRAAVDGELSLVAASERLVPLAAGATIDGYWHGRPGLELVKEMPA